MHHLAGRRRRVVTACGKMISTGLIAAFGLIAAGCGARIPPVTPALVAIAQQQDPTADQARLEQGRLLYVNRCNSCHGLDAPQAYTVDEWRHWVRKMTPKARLDARQQADILGFLLAARALPDHPAVP